MDVTKQQRSKKGNKVDELTREDNLSLVARVVLQDLATEFTQGCFNRELTQMSPFKALLSMIDCCRFSIPCGVVEGYQIRTGENNGER